jgi:hypothetical protein
LTTVTRTAHKHNPPHTKIVRTKPRLEAAFSCTTKQQHWPTLRLYAVSSTPYQEQPSEKPTNHVTTPS